MNYEKKTFTIPLQSLRAEVEQARRWRAAFGQPGGCEDCCGRGYRFLERPMPEQNSPQLDAASLKHTMECWTCMGTGKGEHRRDGGC